MTSEILVDLWKIEEISACDEAVTLGHDFMHSCLIALETGQPANFNARYISYLQHRDECEKCHEV